MFFEMRKRKIYVYRYHVTAYVKYETRWISIYRCLLQELYLRSKSLWKIVADSKQTRYVGDCTIQPNFLFNFNF